MILTQRGDLSITPRSFVVALLSHTNLMSQRCSACPVATFLQAQITRISKRLAGPGADLMESLSSLLQLNRRGGKPRSSGLTEIRGPYYQLLGARYLADVLEMMDVYVDS